MTPPTSSAAYAVAALLTFTAAPAALARDSFGGGDQQCALSTVSPARSTAEDCVGCHTQREHASHPVEVDYARAKQRGGMMARDLRPLAEVQRRGVRLVAGKVSCVTCHDARSRAAYRIAVPVQTIVTAAIDVRDHGSFMQPAAAQRLADLPEGSAISPTALCKACHGLD